MGQEFVILGYVRSTGEFEGHPYDNFNFHVQDMEKKMDAGIGTAVVKVKTDLLINSGIAVNPDVIGLPLIVAYDRYGRVSGVQLGAKK